jgi:hypothetical protein
LLLKKSKSFLFPCLLFRIIKNIIACFLPNYNKYISVILENAEIAGLN